MKRRFSLSSEGHSEKSYIEDSSAQEESEKNNSAAEEPLQSDEDENLPKKQKKNDRRKRLRLQYESRRMGVRSNLQFFSAGGTSRLDSSPESEKDKYLNFSKSVHSPSENHSKASNSSNSKKRECLNLSSPNDSIKNSSSTNVEKANVIEPATTQHTNELNVKESSYFQKFPGIEKNNQSQNSFPLSDNNLCLNQESASEYSIKSNFHFKKLHGGGRSTESRDGLSFSGLFAPDSGVHQSIDELCSENNFEFSTIAVCENSINSYDAWSLFDIPLCSPEKSSESTSEFHSKGSLAFQKLSPFCVKSSESRDALSFNNPPHISGVTIQELTEQNAKDNLSVQVGTGENNKNTRNVLSFSGLFTTALSNEEPTGELNTTQGLAEEVHGASNLTPESSEEPNSALNTTPESTEEPDGEFIITPESSENPAYNTTPESTKDPAYNTTPESTKDPAYNTTPESTKDPDCELNISEKPDVELYTTQPDSELNETRKPACELVTNVPHNVIVSEKSNNSQSASSFSYSQYSSNIATTQQLTSEHETKEIFTLKNIPLCEKSRESHDPLSLCDNPLCCSEEEVMVAKSLLLKHFLISTQPYIDGGYPSIVSSVLVKQSSDALSLVLNECSKSISIKNDNSTTNTPSSGSLSANSDHSSHNMHD